MFKSQFITSKINQWITEVSALSEFAKYEPHVAFAAFTHGLRHRYTFMMRTVPGISDEFKPLNDAMDTFLRTILRGYRFSFDELELFALPAKLGGLGIIIPLKICDTQYSNSRTITEELTSHVTQQNVNGSVDTEKLNQNIAMIKSENTARNKASLDSVRLKLPANKQKVLEAVTEVGASAWLTTVPVNAHDFYLDKKSFWDALRLYVMTFL